MTNADENERQYRVIDQTMTIQSLLRDRYFRRALWLNTIQIALSLFLCVSAFVVDDVFVLLGLDVTRTRLVIGLAATSILVVAITEFRVDWRGKAFAHGEAVRQLGSLKASYRRAWQNCDGANPGNTDNLTAEYERMMASVPSVPESQFIKLKTRHEFKRMLSEEVSRKPTVPLWITWIKLRCSWKDRERSPAE